MSRGCLACILLVVCLAIGPLQDIVAQRLAMYTNIVRVLWLRFFLSVQAVRGNQHSLRIHARAIEASKDAPYFPCKLPGTDQSHSKESGYTKVQFCIFVNCTYPYTLFTNICWRILLTYIIHCLYITHIQLFLYKEIVLGITKAVFLSMSFLLTGGMLVTRRTSIEIFSNEGSAVEEVTDELLTVHEVARRLRVEGTTVRRWISTGILEAIALPHSGKRRAYRVKQSTLTELLQASVLPVETAVSE